MSEEWRRAIEEIRVNQGLLGSDEQTTKQIVIMRLLSVLGWNIFDLEEVRPEYATAQCS